MNLKEMGIDLSLAVAGLAGALMMTSKDSGKSLWQTSVSIIGGAASANYLTPMILKMAHLEGESQYGYATAFLLGFAGLKAIESLSSRLLQLTHHEPVKRTQRRR
jgi:hypothetical protein